MVAVPQHGPVPEREPLGRLIASEPRRGARAIRTAVLGSVIVHGLLIAAIAWLTSRAPPPPAPLPERITLLVLAEAPPSAPAPPGPVPAPVAVQPEPPSLPMPQAPPTEPSPSREREPPPGTVEGREGPPGGRGAQQLVEPGRVPDSIPPAGGERIQLADSGGRGEPGGAGAAAGGGAGAGTGTGGGRPPLDPDAGPVETPYTVRPEVVNATEVLAAQLARWPRAMRRAGIGGRVDLWLLIDEEGRLVRALVQRSSGYPALDRAALEVAGLMQFRPARDGDRVVSVWVIQSLEFKVQ